MGTLVQPSAASTPFAPAHEGPALRLLERRPSARRAAAPSAPATPPDWLSRLAAWAESQPAHRRLGCWTRLR